MPNLEPLGFNFSYFVFEITWESFNRFRRSVNYLSMLIKKFKYFSLAMQISENLLESDRIFRIFCK